MNTIIFKPNEPQIVSLVETAGILDGFYVLYQTSDGRTLQLPQPAAVSLAWLEPAPGEEFSVTKFQKTPKEPVEWVFALTARSEQIRAEREAAELAERTRADLAGQLAASIHPVRPVTEIPRKALEPVQESKGTGTYGPIPQAAPAGRKQREPIPYNVAFVEILAFVTKALNDSGEQWSEQSRQDLISTCLISSSRAGLLGVWER
jgi:hypothetical protein